MANNSQIPRCEEKLFDRHLDMRYKRAIETNCRSTGNRSTGGLKSELNEKISCGTWH